MGKALIQSAITRWKLGDPSQTLPYEEISYLLRSGQNQFSFFLFYQNLCFSFLLFKRNFPSDALRARENFYSFLQVKIGVGKEASRRRFYVKRSRRGWEGRRGAIMDEECNWISFRERCEDFHIASERVQRLALGGCFSFSLKTREHLPIASLGKFPASYRARKDTIINFSADCRSIRGKCE